MTKRLFPAVCMNRAYCKASGIVRNGRMMACRDCYIKADRPLSARAQRVVKELRENPTTSYAELAAIGGYSEESLHGLLKRLAERGIVRRRLAWEVVE